MYKINSLLLKDFYKSVHGDMIPNSMVKSVSYYTPRKSRIERWPKVVNFGLQMFIKTWLIDEFNENFFNKHWIEVTTEYERVMNNSMGKDVCSYDKIKKLHKLCYLPIEIISLPEGM